MMHYVIELALWILAVFFAGCVVGTLLRGLRGREEVAEVVSAPVEVKSEPLVEPVPEPVPEPVTLAAAPEPGHMTRPKGLSEPRNGKPDKLQRITGIGPKYEKLLHHQGVFHFDQIAQWTPEQVAWIDDHLKFRGRITREKWVRQATLLAEGREDKFRREFGSQKRG